MTYPVHATSRTVCETENWTIPLKWASGENGDQCMRKSGPYGKTGWERAAVEPDWKVCNCTGESGEARLDHDSSIKSKVLAWLPPARKQGSGPTASLSRPATGPLRPSPAVVSPSWSSLSHFVASVTSYRSRRASDCRGSSIAPAIV
jgi:hypothetical protein